VIERENGDDGACRHRARAFEDLGDYEKALADYTRASACEPGDADLYLWRGNLHRKWNRRHDLAARDFAVAVRLRPADRRALYALGMACFMTADYDGAIESLSRAIGISPGDGRCYNGRGQSYLRKGNLEEALRDLRKACELREESGCILLEYLAARERTGGGQKTPGRGTYENVGKRRRMTGKEADPAEEENRIYLDPTSISTAIRRTWRISPGRRFPGNAAPERAVRLYYAVRDGIRYDPFQIDFRPGTSGPAPS
jgi:tetratricopeptide (TPR) repeat protein